MATAEEAAAVAAAAEADAAMIPGTPPPPHPHPPRLPGSPTQNAGVGSFSATGAGQGPAPSMPELLQYLKMMVDLMAHDKKQSDKSQLASCKMDEKYFRNVGKFSNLKSGWKEWRRHFLNAVRECDVGWADMVQGLEKRVDPIDHILDYDPTQCQLSTNMYNRLIAVTTGLALQIVESVPHHNGGEAWRLLAKQFDSKTDARLTSLIMSIIGHKIKAKDVQAGLITWEAQLLQLERDHNETLSEKIKRAFLMNVLPSAMQSKVMEHLDRLKSYKEVREKVISFCSSVEDTDIGVLEEPSPAQDQWEGWWLDENNGWRAPEPAEEMPFDIQGLADMTFRTCGGKGHMARDCPTPSKPKGGGKGGKAGGKGGKAGGPKGGKALGKRDGTERASVVHHL